MTSPYPPLNVVVETPRLQLRGASDDLLFTLLPTVAAGVVGPDESPFDDPMSLYRDSPEREWSWLRGIWTGRGSIRPNFWRLYFVVMVDGEPVGMQDLVGHEFGSFGTVTSFSWLKPAVRGSGIGTEARAAILQLAFDGLGASEASSEGFLDNPASNRVSEKSGYLRNGVNWAERRGEPAQLQKWTISRALGAAETLRHHAARHRGVQAGARALAGRPAHGPGRAGRTPAWSVGQLVDWLN